jgi:hypothetical protein
MVLTSNAQFQLICAPENPNMVRPNLFHHSAGRGWLNYMSCKRGWLSCTSVRIPTDSGLFATVSTSSLKLRESQMVRSIRQFGFGL